MTQSTGNTKAFVHKEQYGKSTKSKRRKTMGAYGKQKRVPMKKKTMPMKKKKK